MSCLEHFEFNKNVIDILEGLDGEFAKANHIMDSPILNEFAKL